MSISKFDHIAQIRLAFYIKGRVVLVDFISKNLHLDWKGKKRENCINIAMKCGNR